ncbi:Spo0B domain-containing protein [Petrocella sp. FN5]|uniref:Spo0B domain-containing protein n=1 Tax=Petrocella sp. FN5 TaxID=3032002 RepID=UPI0023DA52E4|nr:sensor histidine kinase [Petrocella sp. FN5]MDF1616277.1 sensor histidine kinase [Petrocella sp. FN5]
MKLHYKIMIVVTTAIILVIGLISLVANHQLKASMEQHMGSAASDMAVVIAKLPELGQKLSEKREDGSIQRQIERLRVLTRYQYIIIMDMEGIQYAYPYKSGLYKPYKNGGEEGVLNEGKAYISADNNELISAIRAFHPIYYKDEQVGAVLVGLLTDEVQKENETHRENIEYALVIGMVLGVILALYLAMDIKKSIFGLEPKEIALLVSERELILHSIEKGIIAIDQKGEVLICNKKSQMMLNLPIDDKCSIEHLSQTPIYDYMLDAIRTESDIANEQLFLPNKTRILISLCLMHDSNNQVIGAVASLENLTQVRALAEELTDYRHLVDSLRAQNHEFMNKLQTISGLLQLGEHEEVLDYIDTLASKNSRFNHLLSEHIRDNKIAGLLLTKYALLSENKIDFVIDQDSFVDGLPTELNAEEACSIIGNLLENAMDAVNQGVQKKIIIFLDSNQDHFIMEIYNSGPPVDEEALAHIYEKGFSTKGNNRGYGLYLVRSIVDNAEGIIDYVYDEGVRWCVNIPRDKSIDR